MNILLVNPPAREASYEPIIMPPLGILYIASAAKSAGFSIDVLDAFAEQMDWSSFTAYFENKHFDVIGITGMTPIFDTVHKAIEICRKHADIIVLGGPHATANADTVLAENPSVDYAIYGEGENSFVELLRILEKETIPVHNTPGIIVRGGKPIASPAITNLDSLSFPYRDPRIDGKYRYPFFPGRRVTSIISSRGCPFSCIFCDKGVLGTRWTARSTQNVLAEIDDVVEQHGVQSIVFYDDLFTVDKRRLAEICNGLIARNYDLTWKAEGRVDLVDANTLELMKRAGCTMLAYGVESANQHGLEFLRKKTTPEMSSNAFKLTREAGIRTMGYFILGIPVETYDDTLRTIRFACEIEADYAQFSVLAPIPGSDLYKLAKEKNWLRHVNAGNVQDKDLLRPAIINEHWNEAKLETIVRRAHRDFYLRPGYMFSTFMREYKNKDLAGLLRSGWKMIKYCFGGHNS